MHRYLIICLAILMSACTGTSQNGIREAEDDFESTPELIACAENADCSDHAEALFWVAAMALSDLSTKEVDVNWHDLTPQERLNLFDGILEPDYDLPEYDVSTSEFLQAYAQMQRSHELGNAYASNELGLLHFENPDLKDLDLALVYLKAAEKAGDPYASFNLARVYLSNSKRDNKLAISSMRNAAELSEDFRYCALRLSEALEPNFQLNREQRSYLRFENDSEEAKDCDHLFAAYFD